MLHDPQHLIEVLQIVKNGKGQSGGFSYRPFQHSCMRVNIKRPQCLQLRAQELIHKEIECDWVSDLSRVTDSLAQGEWYLFKHTEVAT